MIPDRDAPKPIAPSPKTALSHEVNLLRKSKAPRSSGQAGENLKAEATSRNRRNTESQRQAEHYAVADGLGGSSRVILFRRPE